jgi:hypothetical protein
VELLLLLPAAIGLGHVRGGFGWHGHLHEIRCGVDPYFHISTSGPLDGWWKRWFFLRSDTDAPLPVFTGSHPIPQPNWWYGVPQRIVRRMQPLREVIQKLLQGGLMSAKLLQAFFSRRVQLLCRGEVTMWMYVGPSCPDHPFNAELGDTESNT